MSHDNSTISAPVSGGPGVSRPWRRLPVVHSPNGVPRPEWLDKVSEQSLAPAQKIIDSHHHLWDRNGFRYLLDEFSDDIGAAGHNVIASVYVQCRTMYRADGPEELRPVGEVEFVRGVAAQARSGCYGPARVAAAIVGDANLLLGERVAPVLDAMEEAGGGLFRGVRTPVASHPDPAVRSNPVPAPEGLILTDAFRAGAAILARRGLSLDLWMYQSQLAEVAQLADALPDLQIVLNHVGGPLGIGPYAQNLDEHRAAWRDAIIGLARCQNIAIKLGGFGLPVMGLGLHLRETPPDSRELAAIIRPFVETCVEHFGADRCMFESNFPVDKVGFSYGVFWNACHRLAEGWSVSERDRVFHETAGRVYGLADLL